MSTFIALVTFQDYRDRVAFSLYNDSDKMQSHLRIVQEAFIEPLLTTPVYQELITQVTNDTLTPDYSTLLEYVKPVIVFKSYSRYLAINMLEATEKGIRLMRDDMAEPPTVEQIKTMIGQSDADAQIYVRKLEVYLNDNLTVYGLTSCVGESRLTLGIGNVGRAAAKPNLTERNTGKLFDSQQ